MNEISPSDYPKAIQASGFTIYSSIEVGDSNYWIPTADLEALLNKNLVGLNLDGIPNRTRSKVVKAAVCSALGYPSPKSFQRTQPRFPGQQLDIYVQKSNNLQIWNEALSPTRRYAIFQVSSAGIVQRIKVLNGQELAFLDKTGKITKKYQAQLSIKLESHELISAQDSPSLLPHVQAGATYDSATSPADEPVSGQLLPIREIFNRLSDLVGKSFPDPGRDQERNRGAVLHQLVCVALGYKNFDDNGQFPDIRHQILEVKLQTSPTIDLGLVLPSSDGPLDIQQLGDYQVQHRDTRYVIFYATTDGKQVVLTHLFVTTGADFFGRFRRFEGNIINGKIQIPLPATFFDR